MENDFEKGKVESNYLNSLGALSTEFDPLIRLFQSQYSEGKLEKNWRWTLLLLPLFDIASLSGFFKTATAVFKLVIPLVLGPACVTAVISLLTDNSFWFMALGILSFLGTYLLMLQMIYMPKILNIKDPGNFHIAAYRDKCPHEFALLKRSLLFKDFSFKGIQDYVTGVLTHQEKESKSMVKLIEDFDKQRDEYKKRLKDLDTKHNAAIIEYQQVLNEVNNGYKDLEKVTNYLVELLAHINVILFRMGNGLFSLSDLNFLTGFTIYEQDGHLLRKVSNADHGTTGATRQTISLEDERFQHYAVVEVAKKQLDVPMFNEVRDGYYVVSYRMKMGIEGEKVWIFNFHINIETNERAWNLLLNDDILNPSETYRLFHALCLLILKNEHGMEEVHYGEPKR